MIRLVSILVLLFSPSISRCEVLLNENFDGWASYQLYDPWDGIDASVPSSGITLDGVTHYPTEITAPGRGGSGKSMKTWRNGTAWTGNNYHGSLQWFFPAGENLIYIRWYMRTPADFSPGAGVYDQKLFRLNTVSEDEIYFYLIENNLHICPNNGGADCKVTPLNGDVNWRDGDWHAHQLYVNLSTATVTYWIDGGEPTYHVDAVANMPPSSTTFAQMQHFPIGNTNMDEYYQSGWKEIDVDDLVIATTKAETDPTAGQPPASTGMPISIGATMRIGAGSTPIIPIQ